AIIYVAVWHIWMLSVLLTFSIFIQLIGLPNITPYIPLIYGLWTELGLIVGHFADIDEFDTSENPEDRLLDMEGAHKSMFAAVLEDMEWKDGDARNKSPQKIEEDWHKLKRKETLTENIIGFKKILEI
ncbi:hypothetical protein ACJX0J_030838, partial [Zea mays]